MDRSKNKNQEMNYSPMHLYHALLNSMGHEYEYDIFQRVKYLNFLSRRLNICRNNSKINHYSNQNIY